MLLCSSLEGQFDHGLGFDVTTGNRYQNTLIFYGSVCLTFVDFLRVSPSLIFDFRLLNSGMRPTPSDSPYLKTWGQVVGIIDS